MKCDLSSGKTSNILVIDFIYSNYVETLQWDKLIVYNSDSMYGQISEFFIILRVRLYKIVS